MDEKNSYTREDVLEVLVEENRKFREEIMTILYRLIFGMILTVLIVAIGFVSVTHIYFYSPSDYMVETVTTNKNYNENINNNSKVNANADTYNCEKKGSDD